MFTRLAKYGFATIGAVVTAAAFVSLLQSHSLRAWIAKHPYPIFLALVLATFAILIILNYAQVLRGETRRLRARASSKVISSQDRKLFENILEQVPPANEDIKWLRNQFATDNVFAARLKRLQKLATDLRANPIGFDNVNARHAYERFLDSLDEFREVVSNWMKSDDSALKVRLKIVNESQREEAIEAIEGARANLVEAYDKFLSVCHALGID